MNAPYGMPAAVVFDMDGTLLDTETPARAAFIRAIADVGFEYQALVYDRCIGNSHVETKQILRSAYGRDFNHAAMHERWTERFVEHTQLHPVQVKSGVVAVLERLQEHAIPTAVATSNRRDVCERHLMEAGLHDFFQHFVCADEAGRTKPAPDPYLLAAHKLAVAAGASWAIEDSHVGVTAAYRAGFKVFHIPDVGSNQNQEELTVSRVILGSALELLDYL